MVEIRRILCPIDFSETSRHALQHAVAIARWYQSRVTALNVIRVPLSSLPPIPIAGIETSAFPTASERQSREEELRAWVEPARRAGVNVDVLVDEGSAASQIVEQATTVQADLVVMGTHGLSGFERLMLGSVAEKVVRTATCPVMTVPPSTETLAKVPYTRLLCPVDFSESSLAALRFAFSIAEEADAKLTILHVLDWPPDDPTLAERLEAPEMRARIEADVHGRLDGLVTDDVRVWCKPSTQVAYGKPHREIVEMAEREGTDLIVVGVRGRNPIDLTVFGSTTNQVVRRAACPVLTLRP